MRDIIWTGGSVGDGSTDMMTCEGEVTLCVGTSKTRWTNRCADKDTLEGAIRLTQALDLQRSLKRLDLATEWCVNALFREVRLTYLGAPSIPSRGNRDATEQLLPALLRALDGLREQDRTCARPPHWLLFQELPERAQETRQPCQKGDRRGLCHAICQQSSLFKSRATHLRQG